MSWPCPAISPGDYPRWKGFLDVLRQPDPTAFRPELRRRVADELRPLRDMSTGRCASDFVAWRASGRHVVGVRD